MPLRSVALPATLDHPPTAVRFAMRDDFKTVIVLVSKPVLEEIDSPPIEDGGYVDTFKQYRNTFEQIASDKYDKGHIESDGTVCIRVLDLPPASTT